LALHFTGVVAVLTALHIAIELSARLAAASYPAEENYESNYERSKAASNSPANDGGVVLVTWARYCCRCWDGPRRSPDCIGCRLGKIDG